VIDKKKYQRQDVVADPFGNPIIGPNAFDLLPAEDVPDWYERSTSQPAQDASRASTPETDELLQALKTDAKRRARVRPARKAFHIPSLATKKWGKYRVEPYDPDAIDADNDGIVQEGTIWERPAGARIVDKTGKEIAKGFYRRNPAADWKIIDEDGNELDYKPKGVPSKRPKKGSIGEISRTASIGEAIGGTATPAKKGVKKATKTSDARKAVAAPHTLEEREDAIDSWVMGGMRKLRTFITDILNGQESADDAYAGVLKTVAGLEGPARPLWQNYVRNRRRTAILMNAVADGKPHKGRLYRGEYSPLGGQELLELLAPGREYGLPLRSFTEDDTGTIIEEFQQPHPESPVRDGTRITVILESGAITADMRDIAQAVKDDYDAADPDLIKERAGEGVRFTQSEALRWPFSDVADQFINSEEEHIVMGTAEIVSVEWESVYGESIEDAKSDRQGKLTIVIRQTESVGKPENGGSWR
jgi:hypothetical protein